MKYLISFFLIALTFKVTAQVYSVGHLSINFIQDPGEPLFREELILQAPAGL